MALTRQGTRPTRRPLASPSDVMHFATRMPSDRLPDGGFGFEGSYESISSELLLDGQARLNLATFVTTWMPSLGGKLMAMTAEKNMIDKDEYPQTAEIEARCVADALRALERTRARGCDGLLDDRFERGGDAGRGWR